MVTRCPLEIQLRNSEGPECAQIWTGNQNQDATVVELNQINEAIDTKQREMTQVGGAISKEPIYLRINKKNFMDLTLVDLPGLTY